MPISKTPKERKETWSPFSNRSWKRPRGGILPSIFSHHDSLFLAILPLANFGRKDRNSIYFGIMKGSRFSLQCRMTVCSVKLLAPLVTMKTLMAWPRISSGTPIAATSPTPCNSLRVISISFGLTRSPPVFIKSSLLATKYKYPSSSLRKRSPVYRRVSPR